MLLLLLARRWLGTYRNGGRVRHDFLLFISSPAIARSPNSSPDSLVWSGLLKIVSVATVFGCNIQRAFLLDQRFWIQLKCVKYKFCHDTEDRTNYCTK
jgi:hypothetical protein